MMVAQNSSSPAPVDVDIIDLNDHQNIIINHSHGTKAKGCAANNFKTTSKAAAYLLVIMIIGCYLGACFESPINPLKEHDVASDNFKMTAKTGKRQLKDNQTDPKTIKYKETFEAVNRLKELKYQERDNDGNYMKEVMITTEMKAAARDVYPFVLNVGHGTTATHALFYATCHLNLATFHFILFCLPKIEVQTPEDLTSEQRDALTTHFEILDIYKYWYRKCLSPDIDSMSEEVKESCSIQSTISKMEQLKYGITALIQSGAVNALMDSPYPYMAQYIIQEYKRVNKGQEPIGIMSERDPHTWIRKRIQHHYGTEIFCRASIYGSDQFWLDYTEEPFDPFDFDRCLQKALENTKNPPTKHSDVFVNHVVLMAEASEELKNDTAAIEERNAFMLEQMEHVMDAAQSYYRQNSNYHVDLFALEKRMNAEEIAEHIKESIIAAHRQQVLFPSPSDGMKI